MFPLPLLASVLGTSGGGVTQPVPRPSPPQALGPLHGNTPVNSVDAEEAGPAFFTHLCFACAPVSGSLWAHGAKKQTCPTRCSSPGLLSP